MCDTIRNNRRYECGDHGTLTEAELQLKVQRLSAYLGGVLKLPDVLDAEEVETLAVLQQLAAQLDQDYGTHSAAYLVDGYDPNGIDVGFLANTDCDQVAQVTQLGGDVTGVDPGTGQTAYLRDRLSLMLEASELGNNSLPFWVMVVRPKSRIGVDSGTGADCNRLKRVEQANDIARSVQALQTGAKSSYQPLVELGDFNAYPFTAG